MRRDLVDQALVNVLAFLLYVRPGEVFVALLNDGVDLVVIAAFPGCFVDAHVLDAHQPLQQGIDAVLPDGEVNDVILDRPARRVGQLGQLGVAQAVEILRLVRPSPPGSPPAHSG